MLSCSLANGAVGNNATYNTTFMLESKSGDCPAKHSNDELGLKWTEEIFDYVKSGFDTGENREEIFWDRLLS